MLSCAVTACVCCVHSRACGDVGSLGRCRKHQPSDSSWQTHNEFTRISPMPRFELENPVFSLPVIGARAPDVAERHLQARGGRGMPHLRADAVAQGATPPARLDGGRFGNPLRGWQRLAACACAERARGTHIANLCSASRALLLAQAGPFAARSFIVPPTHDDNRSQTPSSVC